MKKLMGLQSDYWKQRCTIKWVQLNQENTEYFHAKATERFSHNTIARILSLDGVVLEYHQQKQLLFFSVLSRGWVSCFHPLKFLIVMGLFSQLIICNPCLWNFQGKRLRGWLRN
jgi:hypothetical protein